MSRHMLTQATIDNTIWTSIETIRQRVQQIPISAEAISRVYGIALPTVREIIEGLNIENVFSNLEIAQVVCSYSTCTIDYATHQVADLLSGLLGLHRLRFYSALGPLGLRSVTAHPDQIGLINAIEIDGRMVFRLPIPGEEHAFSAGEPVQTELWQCDKTALPIFDSMQNFALWQRGHASKYPVPARKSVSHTVIQVLHVQFPVRCLPERLHAMATLPEVTSITTLDGNDAFK
jgi:hypothetical protein